MNPGKLDKLVSLMRPTVTVVAGGQPVETFVAEPTQVWAMKVDKVGREFQIEGQQLTAQATSEFTIRWYDGITAQWRIRYNGFDYAITSPPLEIEGRRAFMLIVTRQIPQFATTSNV